VRWPKRAISEDSNMVEIFAAVMLVLCLAPVAFGKPVPVPTQLGPAGSAPHGYTASGSVPLPSAGAQSVIPKPPSGICPAGWLPSGYACFNSGGR
jgi:hypothetical protein